jgi:hypothetical protein
VSKLTNITSNNVSDFKRKRNLIQIFSIIAYLIILLSALNNYLLGDKTSATILTYFSFLVPFVYLFLYLKKINTAIVYFFTLVIIAIFYFDSYSGINSGTYLYFFPLSLALANLFDVRHKKDQFLLISLLLLILIFVTTNLITDHKLFESKFLTDEQRAKMYVVNLIFAISSLGYFIHLIVTSNLKKIKLIEQNFQQEKEQFELQLSKTKQKEILLAELQHRLKNNLSLMASLIKLKVDRNLFNNTEKTKTEVLHAIQTVGLANHLQTFTDTQILVCMQPFFEKTVDAWIRESNDIPVKSMLKIDCENIEIPVKQAIPFGLILHEIICLTSLSSQDSKHEVHIKLFSTDFLHIEVLSKTDLIGLLANRLNLIEILTDQLDGTYLPDDDKLILTFPYMINFPIIESEAIFR